MFNQTTLEKLVLDPLRIKELVLVVLLCGCLSGDSAPPTTSSTVVSVTSSTVVSTSTTSTSSTTSTTLHSISACDGNWSLVRDWGVFCYDDHALSAGDASLCKSDYCVAYLTRNDTVCEEDDQICVALAAGDHLVCNEIYQRQECKIWYSYVTDNIVLCEDAYGYRDRKMCWSDWAYFRGDISYCSRHQKASDREQCEGSYWTRIGEEKRDRSYCDNIKSPYARSLCISTVDINIKLDETTNVLRLLDQRYKPEGASNMPGPDYDA